MPTIVNPNRFSRIVFSINTKSGNKSTILDTTEVTDFQFEILEPTISHKEKIRINSYSKIKDRLLEIENLGFRLNFVKIHQSVYQNNLMLIDSLLPQILAYSLIYFFEERANSVKDIAGILMQENPIKFDLKKGHNFYAYKLTSLLSEIALGMEPHFIWEVQNNTMGGSLIVEGNEKIVLTNFNDKIHFENYLFQNSKFETPNHSLSKFGSIYNENGTQFINLGLQIRFA